MRYVIGILSVVCAVNLIGRQILSILMQPITQELQISDATHFWLASKTLQEDLALTQ